MQDLSGMSHSVGELAGRLQDALRIETGQYEAVIEKARSGGAGMREQLAGYAKELNDMAERIGARLASIGEELKQKSSGMIGAADQAIGKAGEVGSVFQRQTGVITSAFGEALDRAESLVAKVKQQTDDLAKAASAAAQQMLNMEQMQNATSRDLFLRFATEVIDELNKMAVDINGLLDDDIPDDVWKAFHKGDRSIFARRLVRNKDTYTVPALEQLFEKDNRFRDLVTRYMKKFESLLVQGGKADPEDMLRATFLTADVGKLYLIMSRTLGSVEKLN